MSRTQLSDKLLPFAVRRAWWIRWRIWFLVITVITVLFGWWGWQRWKEEKELRTVFELWDQQGTWRWEDWLASRPNPPDEENGALLIERMAGLKPQNIDTELSFFLLNGETEYRFPQHHLHPEQLQELRHRVSSCKEMLALFPELASKKIFVWPIPLNTFPLTMAIVMHLKECYQLSDTVQEQFQVHLEDGQLKEACEDIHYGLALTRSMEHQLTISGRLSQQANVMRCCMNIQRLLALSEPEDALLIQLQTELVRFDEQQSWKKALFIETGCMNQSILELQQGKHDITKLWGGGSNSGSWWEKLKEEVVTYFRNRDMLSNRQQAECLQAIFIGYQQTDQTWKVQRQYWTEVSNNMKSEQIPGNRRLKHLLLPMMNMLVESEMQLAVKLRTAQIALAAERFRRVEKRWPTSQAELVGRYMQAIQLDPFDDQPLRMKRTDDGLVIYSIGKNNQDDQGMVFPTETIYPALDIGLKLWDVSKRRQSARPLPEEYLKMKEELKEQAGDEKK